MPFSRSTLREIVTRTESDVQSRLPGTDARLRRNLLNIINRAYSGAVHGLYGYLDWLSNQIIMDTAEDEVLDRHANIYLKQPRKDAGPSQGNVACSGVDTTLIPAGSLLQRSDSIEFSTDADATIVAGSVTVAVTSVTGGVDTNTAAASTLQFVSPIPGINSSAAVDIAGLIGGVDKENNEDLYNRLKARIQKPPQGGAKHDYIAWALEVIGVTRAWCYPLEDGAGTVKVRFMMDDKYADGIPLAADVTDVHDYVETLRPVGLAVGGYTTVAPAPSPINFTISVTPNTTAVQDAIKAELADLIKRDSEPGGIIRISRLREAISLAAGETDHVLTAPAADVTHTTNQIATMGTVTFS